MSPRQLVAFPFGTPQHPELTSIQTFITKNYELVFLLLCFPIRLRNRNKKVILGKKPGLVIARLLSL